MTRIRATDHGKRGFMRISRHVPNDSVDCKLEENAHPPDPGLRRRQWVHKQMVLIVGQIGQPEDERVDEKLILPKRTYPVICSTNPVWREPG